MDLKMFFSLLRPFSSYIVDKMAILKYLSRHVSYTDVFPCNTVGYFASCEYIFPEGRRKNASNEQNIHPYYSEKHLVSYLLYVKRKVGKCQCQSECCSSLRPF